MSLTEGTKRYIIKQQTLKQERISINKIEHGILTECPTCGAPGRLDLDCGSKEFSFSDSIWWNYICNHWECYECYLK